MRPNNGASVLSGLMMQGLNIRRVARHVQREGLDPAALLRAVGVDPEVAEHSDALVPMSQVLDVYREAAERTGDPLLGFHISLHTAAADYGLVGFVFENAPTLGAALESFAPLFTALIPIADARFDTGSGRPRLTLRWQAQHPGLEFLRQEVATALVLQARRLVGPFDLVSVVVGPMLPPGAESLEAVFGVPVRPGGERDELVFPSDVLERAIPNADPVLMVHLHEAAEAHVARRREASGGRSDLLRLADCVADLRTGVVSRSGRVARLTDRERALLAFLASRANQVVTHEEIERDVWGLDRDVITYAPAVAIRRLRRKIERDEENPVNLETVFGEGWRLNVPEFEEP